MTRQIPKKKLRFGPGTAWRRWCENAEQSPEATALVFWNAGEPPYRWTWRNLVDTAKLYAAALSSSGVQHGEVCAIIARHNRLLYPIYLGCVCAGAIPAILAYQNPRLHPDKFREGLQGMGKRSGLDWVLTERSLETVLRPLLGDGRSTIKGLLFPLDGADFLEGVVAEPASAEGEVIGSSDPLLLQHSSGTTGLQKPVLLSNRAVMDHVTEYGKLLQISDADMIVSWLPLYHDMGLIATFHLPLALAVPTLHIDPFQWVLKPSLLLEVISAERGTISWLPNFAFSMMADKIREEELDGLNLESWRMAINCSEPVRFRDQEKFFRRFAACGFRRQTLSSCYAMAETTFAVTQTIPGHEPATLAVDASALSRDIVSTVADPGDVKVCVSSGTLIPGCAVRIVDENSHDLPEGHVGEILIRTPWMFDGYRNYPEKTAAALRDGWYVSGDYGFRSAADVYVIGRKKDIIIVAGNNIYPEDVEAAVNEVPGVIPGRVVAFGEEDPEFGSERLSVVAETTVLDGADLRRLRTDILQAGKAVNVAITNVHLVPPRFLVKSSAGKLSRSANRERVLHLKGTDAITQSKDNGNDLRGTESGNTGCAEARSVGAQ